MKTRTTGFIFRQLVHSTQCAVFPIFFASIHISLFLAGSQLRAQTTETTAPTPPPENIVESDAKSTTELIILTGFSATEEIDIVRQSILSQLADLDTNVRILTEDVLPAGTDELLEMTRKQMGDSGAEVAFIVIQSESGMNLKVIQNTDNGITSTNRPVTATQGSPQHEALAVIIRATVLAIREPADESAPTVTDIQTAPNTVPKAPSRVVIKKKKPPVRRPPRQLFAESALAIGHYSPDTSAWLGAAVGLGWSPLGQLVIHANYIFLGQVERKTSELTLKLKRHPIHVGIRLSKLWKNFAIGGGIALNIDIVTENITITERPTPNDRSFDPKSEGPSNHLGLFCYLQAVGHITNRVHIFIRPGIEIPLRHTQYSIDELEVDQSVIKPLPVQPLILVGLQLDML